MTRYEGSRTADERAMLLAFLQYVRACAVNKADGLSDDDLRRSLVPSGTTILGLIKHLAYVERFWFQVVFLGRDEAQLDFPWTDEDPDAEMRVEQGDATSDILGLYRRECAESDAVIAAGDLDAAVEDRGRTVSLRWIGWHLVEETARHNGHIDILREQIDGVVGD